MKLNGLPWKQTEIILSFLRLHLSTAFWTLANYEGYSISSQEFLPTVQFSSQSCLTLCDPMNCSTPGLPVHHQLPEFTSMESVMPSSHLILCRPFSSCPQSLPASGSFQMSQLFTSGSQNIGVSASAPVLPISTQD